LNTPVHIHISKLKGAHYVTSSMWREGEEKFIYHINML